MSSNNDLSSERRAIHWRRINPLPKMPCPMDCIIKVTLTFDYAYDLQLFSQITRRTCEEIMADALHEYLESHDANCDLDQYSIIHDKHYKCPHNNGQLVPFQQDDSSDTTDVK